MNSVCFIFISLQQERDLLMETLIMIEVNLILTIILIISTTIIQFFLVSSNLSKSLHRIYSLKMYILTPYKRSPSHWRRSYYLPFIKKIDQAVLPIETVSSLYQNTLKDTTKLRSRHTSGSFHFLKTLFVLVLKKIKDREGE